MNTPSDQTKAGLRQNFLSARSSLREAERAELDAQICAHILDGIQPESSQQIAAYFAFRGEPNLDSALAALASQRHSLYMPVLKGEDMQFRNWRPAAELERNRYGIFEPTDGHIVEPHHLDAVLMPLVAYDHTGARLGMGGGYYDRSFAFRRSSAHEELPRLIGVAYAIQQSAGQPLPIEDWDVRLDAVVNEHGWHWFTSPP